MASAPTVDLFEEPVFELLAATQSLWRALAESSPPEDWGILYERRCAAFTALERAVVGSSDVLPSIPAASRTALERIAELDAAILQAGGQALEQLQRERIALGSRRRAVVAHALQERDMPRAVTLKA